MTNLLREKLKGLKRKYIDILDEINVIKADGDTAKLLNLREQFDETFDTFFDSEEIAKKYDWDSEEEKRALNKTNKEIEAELKDEDIEELIKFYEGYLSDLDNELIDLKPIEEDEDGEDEELTKEVMAYEGWEGKLINFDNEIIALLENNGDSFYTCKSILDGDTENWLKNSYSYGHYNFFFEIVKENEYDIGKTIIKITDIDYIV